MHPAEGLSSSVSLPQVRKAGWGAFAALASLVLLACADDKALRADRGGRDADPDAADASRDAGVESGSDATRSVSFARDVAPILEQRCVICHGPGSVTGFDFRDPFDPEYGAVNRVNTWSEAHDSPFRLVVKPGDPDNSFLLYKVAGDIDAFDKANNGNPMPLSLPYLTIDELNAVKKWIRDGAKNDAFFSGSVAPIFGTQVTLGSKSGKCTLCHYPGSSTGLDILAVFDPTTGLVGADSFRSEKPRVVPGNPEGSFLVEKLEEATPSSGRRMPLQYDRLGPAQVDLLRAWIAAGAKDD